MDWTILDGFDGAPPNSVAEQVGRALRDRLEQAGRQTAYFGRPRSS